MIAAALLALVLVAIGLLVAIAALVWLVVYLVRSRGEESDAPGAVDPHACGGPDQCEVCNDWMDIADVVSDDHAAALHVDDDYYDIDGIALEGFTPLEVATWRRNYLPLTDPERARLDLTFKAIVEGADR